MTGKNRPEYRRLAVDVKIQVGLGRFFGAKLRSGALYRMYERTGDPAALNEALKAYRSARASWSEIANMAQTVYKSNTTVGENPQLRGHWLDRLPAIDTDIAKMAEKRGLPKSRSAADAIHAVLGRPRREMLACQHKAEERFHPGQPLDIALSVQKGSKPVTVSLYYRHVTQAERYESAEMQWKEGQYRGAIPGSYTNANYPLEYYFELKQGPAAAFLYPASTRTSRGSHISSFAALNVCLGPLPVSLMIVFQ